MGPALRVIIVQERLSQNQRISSPIRGGRPATSCAVAKTRDTLTQGIDQSQSFPVVVQRALIVPHDIFDSVVIADSLGILCDDQVGSCLQLSSCGKVEHHPFHERKPLQGERFLACIEKFDEFQFFGVFFTGLFLRMIHYLSDHDLSLRQGMACPKEQEPPQLELGETGWMRQEVGFHEVLVFSSNEANETNFSRFDATPDWQR